ncbi:AmmeMemoRadiSam system protein A [Anaeromicrobium sediminis]|uniref:AMMECR1 domain-containing protein n=1 Tax=Anaeromicrobium sediminis TaxID=1478221 RepID=A0A267MBH0_9FIRM|nr:AmmeMemoRadiSam system protein A [Anaeromicrobium sediminis]PAB56924.1 AMMECR1 domain-containing protein [Anaeromicrobium sediminis]
MGKILKTYLMPHPPIILPEVGKGEERKIQNTIDSCNEIAKEIGNLKPDTIIVITPHGPVFNDAVAISYGTSISGDLRKFGVDEVGLSFNNDKRLVDEIYAYSNGEGVMVAKIDKNAADTYGVEYELDHGALVPLYFIEKEYKDFNLVHITYGMLSKMQLYKFGMALEKALDHAGKNAVIIGSGDLSHKLKELGPYEYSPYGPKFDEEIIKYLGEGDILEIFNMDPTIIEQAGECGMRSIYIMAGAMNDYNISGEVLSYEGPFGVGYGVVKFNLEKSNENRYEKIVKSREEKFKNKLASADPYVRLARESLTHYLTHGTYTDMPEYVTDEMKNEARGVFVSLKVDGDLRGCIGTFLPTTKNIASEIIRNAVEAGEHDPRFNPVHLEELKDIDFSVDVLTKPEKASISELDPKEYGVIVKSGRKSGLLLPDLEGVNTVEEQLNIVLRKAGIEEDEAYEVERFKVIRHKE